MKGKSKLPGCEKNLSFKSTGNVDANTNNKATLNEYAESAAIRKEQNSTTIKAGCSVNARLTQLYQRKQNDKRRSRAWLSMEIDCKVKWKGSRSTTNEVRDFDTS